MASELVLDRTDPGIEETVADWTNGAEYIFDRVRVKQTGTDPKTAKFEVISVEGGEPAEPEEEPEGEYPAEKPKPKGKMGKPAMTITFGH
jgi:hypothetical protein